MWMLLMYLLITYGSDDNTIQYSYLLICSTVRDCGDASVPPASSVSTDCRACVRACVGRHWLAVWHGRAWRLRDGDGDGGLDPG